jgi:hypothetical protein
MKTLEEYGNYRLLDVSNKHITRYEIYKVDEAGGKIICSDDDLDAVELVFNQLKLRGNTDA